jgi:hypothetical protein
MCDLLPKFVVLPLNQLLKLFGDNEFEKKVEFVAVVFKVYKILYK